MTLTVEDVRLTIDSAASEFLTEKMIQGAIDDSELYIEKYVADGVDESKRDVARKRIASWLTYTAYTGSVSANTGEVPESLKEVLDQKCLQAEQFLNLISSEEVYLSKKKRFAPNQTMSTSRMFGNPTLRTTRSNNIG